MAVVNTSLPPFWLFSLNVIITRGSLAIKLVVKKVVVKVMLNNYHVIFLISCASQSVVRDFTNTYCIACKQDHIRDIKTPGENPKAFVSKFGYQPIKAIIEYVRDGSTVRLCLLPDFYQITLMLSGIRVSIKYFYSKYG